MEGTKIQLTTLKKMQHVLEKCDEDILELFKEGHGIRKEIGDSPAFSEE